MSTISSKSWFPIFVMIAAPALFSTNLIFGRFVADQTDPFVLAFVRWSCVAIILFPFVLQRGGTDAFAVIKQNWIFLFVVAFLGMGISGSGVYLGLKFTTATNATLIYSTAPIIIILLERLFSNRKSNIREGVGIALAFVGVAIIVLRGDYHNLATLTFNLGDILILLASMSWAGYSILYRSERVSHLGNIVLFGVIAFFGALVNIPIAAYQLMHGSALPSTPSAWAAIVGIIFISSITAFSAYQYGVRKLGASVAGLFMYLMTPYGVLMAVIFLGEQIRPFHLVGIVCVMIGVGAATFPKKLLDKLAKRS